MKNRGLSDSCAIRWLYLILPFAAMVCPSAGIARSAEPARRLAGNGRSLTFVVTADNHSGYNDSQKAVWQAIGPHRGTFAMTAGDVGSAGGIRRVIDECLGASYPWYAAVGNHDLRSDRIAALRALNPGGNSLPNIVNPGPPNCKETTYSFRYENCHFVILNQYYDGNSDIGYKTSDANGNAYVCEALYDWLEADLDAARADPKVQHIFVTAHEPLYYATDQGSPLKIDLFNDYDLGRDPQNRDRFWKLLKQQGVLAFFCGHHHVFRAHRMDKNDVWQVVSAWGRGCDPPNASDRWKHVKCTFVKVTINGSTVTYEAHRGPRYGGPRDTPYTVEHSGTLAEPPLAGASAREGDLVADDPNDIAADASVQDHPTPAPDARQVKTRSGPLKVHPTNPRYFTDDSGRALYFAGSDTYGLNHKFDEWPSFTGRWSYFVEFLDWMESHNQNFLRCWGGFSYLVSDRHPWQRTGPGSARDGDPKFDMSRFDQSYFEMLKGRLAEIQRRGLHTSITIFGSYNMMRDDWENTAWHPDNNVNPEIANALNPTDPHSFFTTDPEALRIQKMLIAKFVDELNEYDCHIWEIMNETGVAPEIRDWYYGMVDYVRDYEAGKPKQHLVGMTPGWDRGKRQPREWIYDSPADWIQIGGGAGVPADEFASGGSATYTDKLLFLDTDHTPWHTQKNADAKSIQKWVWKTFARGHHPLMLEMYRHGDAMHPDQIRGEINHAYDFVRRALGDTVTYSKRFRSLAQMIPTSAPTQCSTKYCLRNPGQDYLVYQPQGGPFTMNLRAADYEFEWFDPAAGVVVQSGALSAGAGRRTFTPPFSGDAVLYLELASRGRR